MWGAEIRSCSSTGCIRVPAPHSLDEAGRVIYIGSFSKVLFPSLRIGYLVVPDGLMDAFTAAQRLSHIHVPALEQAVLADFLAEGHFGRHVRRMRALYAARGAALIRAIRRQAGGALEVRSAHAGLHLVGWLPTGTDDRAAAARAAQHGVQAQPLSAHALQPPRRGGLLLGYAAVPQPEIEQGAQRLAEALRRGHTNPRRSAPSGHPRAQASPRSSGSQPGAHDGDKAQEASAAEDACQATAWPPGPAVVGFMVWGISGARGS